MDPNAIIGSVVGIIGVLGTVSGAITWVYKKFFAKKEPEANVDEVSKEPLNKPESPRRGDVEMGSMDPESAARAGRAFGTAAREAMFGQGFPGLGPGSMVGSFMVPPTSPMVTSARAITSPATRASEEAMVRTTRPQPLTQPPSVASPGARTSAHSRRSVYPPRRDFSRVELPLSRTSVPLSELMSPRSRTLAGITGPAPAPTPGGSYYPKHPSLSPGSHFAGTALGADGSSQHVEQHIPHAPLPSSSQQLHMSGASIIPSAANPYYSVVAAYYAASLGAGAAGLHSPLSLSHATHAQPPLPTPHPTPAANHLHHQPFTHTPTHGGHHGSRGLARDPHSHLPGENPKDPDVKD
jgi:hypothetical protein